MNYYTIEAPPILKPYIRFYWVFEGNERQEPYVYRSLADGCAELIFHYKGAFRDLDQDFKSVYQPAHIHAQSNRFRRFITNEAFGIFGVYLYPYAIPRLLGIPSSELSNTLADLDLVFGREAKEIEERMMLAENNADRANIITFYLSQLLLKTSKPETNICNAIRLVIHDREIRNVRKLASDHCLSERQFERKFKELAGFTPKSYLRIIRFQNALKEYGKSFGNLSELAQYCGYYDQAHFIHDFKEFSGFHPSHYFAGGAEGSEYREV